MTKPAHLQNLDESMYLAMLNMIVDKGTPVPQRNGVRYTLPNLVSRYDLSNQTLPLVTTRFTSFTAIKAELLWFLSGSSNINDLHTLAQQEGGKGTIWDMWALTQEDLEGREPVDNPDMQVGSIGRIYAHNWNAANIKILEDNPLPGTDLAAESQLERLIRQMKDKPYDTQHILTSYDFTKKYQPQVSRTTNILNGNGALSPCHGIHVQFTIVPGKEGDELHVLTSHRSQDCPVGKPYNVAMYALLTHMVAKLLPNTKAVSLTWVGANAHVYENQIPFIEEQTKRTPFKAPTIAFADEVKTYTSLKDFRMQDIRLVNYQYHTPQIKYPVSE